jgi:hypothetical protein
MLAELGYQPAAPSHGFGDIAVPIPDLEVNARAREYPERFIAEENTNHFFVGCTDYAFNRAAVLALEAFRLMNAGQFWDIDDEQGPALVPALLRKAAEEYERAVREELRHYGR